MNAFELYLDGKRIADLNNIHERTYHYAAVELEAGKLYQIRLDYHEFVNDADIRWCGRGRQADRSRMRRWRQRHRPTPWCWCWASRRASKARR